MLVYVNPGVAGNVFIRVAPNTGAPSTGIPAYNSKNIGILYDVDEQHRDDAGEIWYHLRGLGWSMARYFEIYRGANQQSEDITRRWLVGLTREEIEQCIDYLKNTLEGEGVD